MDPVQLSPPRISWRWWAAALLFLAGFVGLLAGVSLSERPDVVSSTWLTKAYYALGYFVFGGLDVGTPDGGPGWAQTTLWIAYFGAPALTASAVVEAVIQVIAPDRWHLQRIRDHIVIFGAGPRTLSYLSYLQQEFPATRTIVVAREFEAIAEQEFRQKFHATPVIGDLTHDYLLRSLRLRKAKRVVLLGNDDFQAFEAASRVLEIAPHLAGRIVLHCHNLRFMRSLQETELAQQCQIFNTYNLAAKGFVRSRLIEHFKHTSSKDIVVMAGFGRFGQSVLEELQAAAADEIAKVAVIDKDADRRVLVVDEQNRVETQYSREVFQGDIGHPIVWQSLAATIDLAKDSPTIILGTGQEQENLRTAIWLKQRYPNAMVYARTNEVSRFASSVGAEYKVEPLSITQLAEENFPRAWLD
jgi:voltage-gated potassium channel Kch